MNNIPSISPSAGLFPASSVKKSASVAQTTTDVALPLLKASPYPSTEVKALSSLKRGPVDPTFSLAALWFTPFVTPEDIQKYLGDVLGEVEETYPQAGEVGGKRVRDDAEEKTEGGKLAAKDALKASSRAKKSRLDTEAPPSAGAGLLPEE